ncbi:MAG: hypothetical protein U0X20_07915 [Caldilineaceae bacterium]
MKQLSIVIALLVAGMLAWLFASRLSSDALGMAVGLLFGILAGIPTALLVLAEGQRRRELDDEDERCERYKNRQVNGLYQPPVIVLAAPAAAPQPPVAAQPGSYYYREVGPGQYVKVYTDQPAQPAQPASHGERKFKVVGERDDYIDQW